MAVENPDDLYGLPLERFVPERGALSRALRDGGDREEAARIAKLRKPSVAAWAVNQLVRTQRKAVGELFEAGEAAQQAQAELIAGRGDAGTLRTAAARERAAVESLLEAARGLLSSGGHELSPTMLERVADTLHAAALGEHARQQVSNGCLERELRHVGMAAGSAVPDKAPKRARQKDALRAARAAEADARRASDRAARQLEIAAERRDRAADALEEAEAELEEARERARAAAEEHERLAAELERSQR